MSPKYKILPTTELITYLESKSIDPYHDNDYQLQTNLAFVFLLENGEVVLLPNSLKNKGILFTDKETFEEMIKEDSFPVENTAKSIFEIEAKSVLNINKNAIFFQEYLNRRFNLSYTEINEISLSSYYKHILNLYKKGEDKDKDIISLIGLSGEFIRNLKKGRWCLIKRYGDFNPYYQPIIVTNDEQVILISNRIFGMLESRIDSFDKIISLINLRFPQQELKNFIEQGNIIKEL